MTLTLLCLAKDPIHLVLALENLQNHVHNTPTVLLRSCLLKLRLPFDDGRPYFRIGGSVMRISSASELLDSFNSRRAAPILRRIRRKAYRTLPYRRVDDFRLDFAAIFQSHSPGHTHRKIRTNVINALSAIQLELLWAAFLCTRFTSAFFIRHYQR